MDQTTPSADAARIEASGPPATPSATAGQPADYGVLAKWFHWVTVLLLLVALPMGHVIKHIKDSDKAIFYQIHESAGLTILIVAVLRLLWRQANPPPAPAPGMPRVLHTCSHLVHLGFYILLIVQPILGFLATNAWGFPMQGDAAYLGLIDFPKFTEANQPVAEGLQLAHTVGGWALLALLTLHVGAVVFHQALRRDNTLLRMV